MGFIYIWENKINNKKYLGKCQGSPDSSYIGSGKYFKKAVHKFGIENFDRTILEYVDDPKKLIEREQYWLDFYNVSTNPEFYNISQNSGGGHHGANYNGDKNPMWGRKHPNHKPHYGAENGMYGVRRIGATNPNAKAVTIIDSNGNVYKGECLKEVCMKIFGHDAYYGRMKHLVKTCESGKCPRSDSMFYKWQGFYNKE